jgi:hypothetical protein
MSKSCDCWAGSHRSQDNNGLALRKISARFVELSTARWPPRDGERCHQWQQVQYPERTLLDQKLATIMIATTMNAATSERARSRLFDTDLAISSSRGIT